MTFVITIDGFTASGKGTLASKIANELGFSYMDTGALYRGVAKTVLDMGLNPAVAEDAVKGAYALKNNYDVSIQNDPSIRTEAVSKGASEVAAVNDVRAILLDLQKDFCQSDCDGVVIEGRDTGTVICPEADIKFFIEASAEVRAERRFKQLQGNGMDADLNEIIKQLNIRDGRDAGRSIAPTKPADDAIVIETSDMNAQQVFDKVLGEVKAKL